MSRMLGLLLAGILAGQATPATSAAPAAEAAPQSVQLAVTSPLKPVLRSDQPACGPADIPDAGLRAYRRDDGNVVVFANGYENFSLIGPNLQTLRRVCRSSYHSLRDADPSHFDDETWIAATWTDDGRNVMAIGHHEYHGEQHPGHCLGTTPRQCRYGVLLHLISHDGGLTFHKTTQTPLAAVPLRQQVDQQRDTGFFQPSNIFELDGWKYVFVRSSGGGAQPPATCLMRAREALNPASWTIFDGATFRPALFDPYKDDLAARPICQQIPNLNGLVWSVVKHRDSGLWVALVSLIEPSTKHSFVATATSRDALHWSPPTRIEGPEMLWAATCPTSPFLHYPAILDTGSARPNFDDTGSTALLFVTRIQIKDCRFTMARDLGETSIRLIPGGPLGRAPD